MRKPALNVPRLNWPKKGDRAFSLPISGEDKSQVEAFFMRFEGMYAAGFQRAADMVVDAARADDGNPDDLLFPVAYLYRHHLELMLKGVVALGARSGAIDVSDDCLVKHDLQKLWIKVKQLIDQVWADSPQEDLKAVAQVVMEFHKLDPSGQAFRYARGKKGSRLLENIPSCIDLNNLKETVAAVSAFLCAVHAGIDYCDPGAP